MNVRGKTDQEIVTHCNKLARLFYASHGCAVPVGYRFDQASHPQEQGMWNLAAIAYEFLLRTDPKKARRNIEDEQ